MPKVSVKDIVVLPSAVLDVAAKFKADDKQRKLVKQLTESKDKDLQAKLVKMWVSLEKASVKKSRYSFIDNGWVLGFLIATGVAAEPQPYHLLSSRDKAREVGDIKKYAELLTKKLKNNNLDYHLIYSKTDDRFYFLEGDYINAPDGLANMLSRDFKGNPTASDVLNKLVNIISNETAYSKGSRRDGHGNARYFVAHISDYLRKTYGTSMNSIVITATKAVCGVEYELSDIRKIITRRKQGQRRK